MRICFLYPVLKDYCLFATPILLAIFIGMSLKLHSPLARVMYDKFQHAQEHTESKHEYWYTIRTQYLSTEVINCFTQSTQDKETSEFLQACLDKSDWFFTQLYHTISKSILSWFMTLTSANGLLNRSSMFVFSMDQFLKLLNVDSNWHADKLLDLGAGDGKVTAKMAPMFSEVFTTEMSSVMRWRLRQANYTVVDVDDWDKAGTPAVAENFDGNPSQSIITQEPASLLPPQYDVVSCLNLLDRCDTPLTLLQRIRRVLKPDTGRLVLALVLPLKQYVEVADRNQPSEVIDISGSHVWEVQFESFVKNVLEPSGFHLLNWTRLPYLCEGDFTRSFYTLNDVVIVAQPTPSIHLHAY